MRVEHSPSQAASTPGLSIRGCEAPVLGRSGDLDGRARSSAGARRLEVRHRPGTGPALARHWPGTGPAPASPSPPASRGSRPAPPAPGLEPMAPRWLDLSHREPEPAPVTHRAGLDRGVSDRSRGGRGGPGGPPAAPSAGHTRSAASRAASGPRRRTASWSRGRSAGAGLLIGQPRPDAGSACGLVRRWSRAAVATARFAWPFEGPHETRGARRWPGVRDGPQDAAPWVAALSAGQ